MARAPVSKTGCCRFESYLACITLSLLILGESMNKILTFFRESYSELKKVVWPSRDDVSGSTRVVIVSTVIFAVVLGVVDFLLLLGIDLIF